MYLSPQLGSSFCDSSHLSVTTVVLDSPHFMDLSQDGAGVVTGVGVVMGVGVVIGVGVVTGPVLNGYTCQNNSFV